MNKEIKPTYVTFEQAKLLKEKGFDEITKSIYQYENLEIDNDYVNFRNSLFSYDHFEISAPEQWQVVEWLRVKYGIWVSIFHKRHSENKHYGFVIKQANELETKLWEFPTPQEAYSKAFDYILKQLI
jgi:hypothetical protein